MALYTQARRRGQMLSNRRNLRRNVQGGYNGIAPGDSPKGQTDVPSGGANQFGYTPIKYGALGKMTGVAKVGQARNQPGFIPRGQRDGVPAVPGNAYQQGENFATYQERVNNRGANADITPEQLAQYGSYAAAIRANAANNFSLEEWGALPAEQFAQNLQTLLSNPGAARLLPEGGLAQLQALAAQRGIPLQQPTAAAPMTGPVPGRDPGTPTNYDFGDRPLGSAAPSTQQLGSDGKYHDINQPLPPGVTLKPPPGATAPQTQPVSAVAEAAHGTPQAAINAGKDPTKHLAYWEDKGWTYNPATDSWRSHNKDFGPRHITEGAQPAAPAQAGAAAPTMPLDPAYIAAQRAAQLQLNSTLQGTYPALEQINAQNQLALARMGTNQGYDTQALKEALSSRGALQSSVYGNELGNLATNYMRTGQDLAADVANAQSQVFQQQQGAYNDYYAALIEALLASAANSATSPYTPVGKPNRNRNRNRNRTRNRNRGGR